jgi:hypothetical protein
MYKALALIVLILVGSVSARTRTFSVKSNPIERVVSPFKQGNNAIDWCPQCIDSFDDLIDIVLNIILQYGVLDSCGTLCNLVVEKTGSEVLGFICTFGCAVLGIEEFVKLIENADIDPIYYCEEIKLCPINDNGDAKFKSFIILPARAPMGTKFALDFVYVSNNGTGTGEIILTIKTVDKIPLSAAFLLEAQQPGTYGERVAVDASPDPDCDPSQGKN